MASAASVFAGAALAATGGAALAAAAGAAAVLLAAFWHADIAKRPVRPSATTATFPSAFFIPVSRLSAARSLARKHYGLESNSETALNLRYLRRSTGAALKNIAF